MGKTESTLRKTSIIGFIVTAVCLLFLCALKLQEMYFRSYYMVLESSSEFETIKNGIIYFGRPSCPECKTVEPIIQDIANENQIKIYYFNTEYIRINENIDRSVLQEYLSDYRVEAVPTIIVVRHGLVVECLTDILQAESKKTEISEAVMPYKDMANHRTPFYMVTSVMLAVSIAMLLLSFFLSDRLVGRKWMSFVIICDICMLFILVAGWAMGIMYIEKTGGSGNPEETINGLIANGLMVVTTIISIFRYNQKKQ